MWVEKCGNKYNFFERYIDPLTGARKKVSCLLEKNTNAYKNKAAAILQHKIDERLQNAAHPEMITLQTLIDKYAAHQAVTVKASTASRNACEAKAVARILGGDSLVERMTVPYVMDKFTKSKETVTCTNARIKYLKACIRWGYKSDLLSTPALADKIEYLPDRRKKEKLQTKYMEPEELQTLLDAMKIERWKLLTEFLCLSGLRIGEMIALTDSDLSVDYIHINKTYDLRFGTLHDTPKTEASNRDVFIQPELSRCIKRMRTERKKMLFTSGNTSDLFYPDPDGGYMHYYAYNKYLGEVTERVLGRKLTPHACRHTMTSIFAAQGVDLDAISRRLGHESSDITKEIYLHATGEQRKHDEAQISKTRILKDG